MKQISREWLDAASDDLLTIESIINNPGLTNIAAFHAQQAIEKSLKALIEDKSLPFVRTHNIQTLVLRIEDYVVLNVNEMVIAELDRLYIDARYPGELGLMPSGKPTLEEARGYYSEARNIYSQVKDLLFEGEK